MLIAFKPVAPRPRLPRADGACQQLLEMEYDDGGAPPPEIIHKWLDEVQTTFHDAPDSSGPNGSEGPAIAVHCVAGLGRAPVLVAIALIEYGKVRVIVLLLEWHRKKHLEACCQCKQ